MKSVVSDSDEPVRQNNLTTDGTDGHGSGKPRNREIGKARNVGMIGRLSKHSFLGGSAPLREAFRASTISFLTPSRQGAKARRDSFRDTEDTEAAPSSRSGHHPLSVFSDWLSVISVTKFSSASVSVISVKSVVAESYQTIRQGNLTTDDTDGTDQENRETGKS